MFGDTVHRVADTSLLLITGTEFSSVEWFFHFVEQIILRWIQSGKYGGCSKTVYPLDANFCVVFCWEVSHCHEATELGQPVFPDAVVAFCAEDT